MMTVTMTMMTAPTASGTSTARKMDTPLLLKDSSSSPRTRRAVRICEQANQVHVISNGLTNVKEANKVWYNEEEFYQMKINRRMTIERNRRQNHANERRGSFGSLVLNNQNDDDDNNEEEDICSRGLERLLPGGNEILKRRTTAIKCIIKMYHHLQQRNNISGDDGSKDHDDEEERQKVLSVYSISKTRYARHTALYLAAQDAAAVGATATAAALPVGVGADAGAVDRHRRRSESWPLPAATSTTASRHQQTLFRLTNGTSAPTASNATGGRNVSSKHPHNNKVVTLNKVNERNTPATALVQQRRVPLRATMA